ncbi:hypothetical protein [Desulfovibrio sp. JC022]|uniref:hypothetical protein n=1 Tax=Desulfovibrio sp. JC022 TaxID=2593642 RepID=UPI0013D2C37E|nr:hypothetical protein [Desulfovibrio sp. JC022]NDV22892.1 hypothetical protein [Desulfovibrio sp. JC022]
MWLIEVVTWQGYAGKADFNPDEFTKQESVMQERFCKCGNRVMVQYHSKKDEAWFTRFWVMGNTFGKTIRVCPDCGSPLDINRLN